MLVYVIFPYTAFLVNSLYFESFTWVLCLAGIWSNQKEKEQKRGKRQLSWKSSEKKIHFSCSCDWSLPCGSSSSLEVLRRVASLIIWRWTSPPIWNRMYCFFYHTCTHDDIASDSRSAIKAESRNLLFWKEYATFSLINLYDSLYLSSPWLNKLK